MTRSGRCALVFALVAAALFPSVLFAAEAKVRIVFFTPHDVEPPEGVPLRMKEVVDYAQAFYGKWLTHWKYEPEHVLPIDRDGDGIPRIYYVRGDKTAASGAYDDVGFQGAVREKAIARNNISRQGSTWWIFVYGTKLKASRGYGGFADAGGNGWALLVWHEVPGELSLDTPLAGGVADQINLKGYLHELGHTMNLAHFGPLDRMSIGAAEGMSLMGPNARTYRRARRNTEEKVHLTEATAALIWKQPQMTGRFEPDRQQPKIQVDDFQSIYDARKREFRLSGRLRSNVPAHSIVAIDMPDKGPDDYWKKAHAGRLSEEGRFDLPIGELAPSSGMLQVVFCFDNGYITGTGEGFGYRFSARIPYRYDGKTYIVGVAAK